MNKEKEILHLMKSLDISRQEAEQLWEDDNSDYESDEMKAMGENAKKNGLLKVGAKASNERKATTRERKPNEDQRYLMDCLHDTLKDFDDCAVVNPERQIDFVLNGVHYSVTLTAHRPKKGK